MATIFLKTDRDRQRLTETDLSKRRWPFAVRWSFAVVAGFAVFRCFLLPFVIRRHRSPFALGSLILRDVGNEH